MMQFKHYKKWVIENNNFNYNYKITITKLLNLYFLYKFNVMYN